MSEKQDTVIAIQGQAASFHDIVAKRCFSDQDRRIHCDTFADVFSSIQSKRASIGICAIENSLAGSINQVYDLLLKHANISIIGEYYLKVEQCLIGLSGAATQNISEVHSHPVALAQCQPYLDMHLPHAKRLEEYDTASSVELVKQRNDPAIAAIGGEEAAKLHNLAVLAHSIQSNTENYTRFLVIGNQGQPAKKTNKTSLVIQTSHQPGALYEALGAFAKQELNLSKLQSRPIPENAWQYMFYIDVEAGIDDAKLQTAVAELEKQHCRYTVLGSYASASHT